VFPISLETTKPENWLLTFTKIFFFSILTIVPETISHSLGYLISGEASNNSSNRAMSLSAIIILKIKK